MTSDKLKLRIFQVNDVYELDLFPNLKTLIDSNKGEADHVLVVMAGDFLGPSLLSSLDKGRGMVDTMMMCGFTHRSEEHTSELQSRQSISYAVFCL